MFTIKLPTIAAAAVIAAGLFAAADLAQSRTDPSAADVVASRFPTKAEMVIALNENTVIEPGVGAAGRILMPAAACVREHWPYIADECLTTQDGRPVRAPTRTITIERQVAATATAKVLRMASATDVAAR